MKKLLFILLFFLASSIVYGADAEIRGETASGTFLYISVDDTGKINLNQPSAFSDGSNEVNAKVDTDNYVYVNMAKDSRPIAQKTTTNTLATSIPQTVTPIANQRTVTIVTNETGKYYWVKVGDVDAGEDSGYYTSGGIIVDNASGAVISYYASPSVKICIIQE
jgi:biopolymer transport protein ExbD